MKNCASSWLFTRIIPICTVNKTKKKQYGVFREHRPNFLQLVSCMLRSCWVDIKQLQEVTSGAEISRRLIIDNQGFFPEAAYFIGLNFPVCIHLLLLNSELLIQSRKAFSILRYSDNGALHLHYCVSEILTISCFSITTNFRKHLVSQIFHQ